MVIIIVLLPGKVATCSLFPLQLRHSYQVYDKTLDKRQVNNPPFRIALSYDASVEKYVTLYYFTCICNPSVIAIVCIPIE